MENLGTTLKSFATDEVARQLQPLQEKIRFLEEQLKLLEDERKREKMNLSKLICAEVNKKIEEANGSKRYDDLLNSVHIDEDKTTGLNYTVTSQDGNFTTYNIADELKKRGVFQLRYKRCCKTAAAHLALLAYGDNLKTMSVYECPRKGYKCFDNQILVVLRDILIKCIREKDLDELMALNNSKEMLEKITMCYIRDGVNDKICNLRASYNRTHSNSQKRKKTDDVQDSLDAATSGLRVLQSRDNCVEDDDIVYRVMDGSY